MEIKYFYRLFYCENPDDPECLKQTATLVDAEPIKKEWDLQNFTNEMAWENALTRPYHTYLLSSLHSDFNENRFGACGPSFGRYGSCSNRILMSLLIIG